MIIIKIKATSPNKKLLISFFDKFKDDQNLLFNSIVLKKPYKQYRKIKKFTLLKSPHVNKNAQEQFEFKNFFFSKNLYVNNTKNFYNFLKKLKKDNFAGVNTIITVFYNNKSGGNKFYDPDNFKINAFSTKEPFFKTSSKTSYYLQLLDVYGEKLIRKSI